MAGSSFFADKRKKSKGGSHIFIFSSPCHDLCFLERFSYVSFNKTSKEVNSLERPALLTGQTEPPSSEIESAIRQVKSGDSETYAVIIRAFEKKIYTYCFCILKSREEAEDAVQDIFIKAYQELDRYEKRVSFSAWLYKIAYHHCLDQIRKQNRWKRLVSRYQEQVSSSYVRRPNDAVQELLQHLNQEETNLLLLKAVEQYSFEEIGQIIGCKPTTLRKKYERLRKKLIEHHNLGGGIVYGEMAGTT